MKHSLYDRFYKRELGNTSRYSSLRGTYGDKTWVDNLDIVNELGGHQGCVNALSWSRSGRLLASGSDDTHINIHSYLPDSSTDQFQLTTSIATGHTANIFSVKFMPHSNDRTIVSAAGDAEVRIFDIERSGHNATASAKGSRLLTSGDTNGKVFRSHSERVKRVVTESSPYLFLTCSEDGEVRQWDIRQPSSAYPAPKNPYAATSSDDVPPPLISYRKHRMDLNTISCSPSQPHYIALGGAHLHCFLHDRRMTGRDVLRERGANFSPSSSALDRDEELMSQATRCVKRFAPNGQRRMGRSENGHITACKISDANPNEIIASWSGDWIYSFDINRSPDARDAPANGDKTKESGGRTRRVKHGDARKRKRAKAGSAISLEAAERGGSRQRTESEDPDEEVALMVQYQNGQREEIPIEPPTAGPPLSAARNSVLTESQRHSALIAKGTVKLRKRLFTLGDAKPKATDSIGHASSFTTALGIAASILPDMSAIMRGWRYPVNPLDVDVQFQNRLRHNRASAWRFVQAAGVLARVCGGKLQTAGAGDPPELQEFLDIRPAPGERPSELRWREQFGYDFLKAICLWLDSGPGRLLDAFSPPAHSTGKHPRFPIPRHASIDDIDDHLIPYLLNMACDEPIRNVDASRFEVDENRQIFASEKKAVLAFASALKMPLVDLVGEANTPSNGVSAVQRGSEGRPTNQDRSAARKFWAFKVGRGVLLNAAEGVNFAFVDRAFGGLGQGDSETRKAEKELGVKFKEITTGEDEDDPVVTEAKLVERLWKSDDGHGGRAMVDTDLKHDGAAGTPDGAAILHPGRASRIAHVECDEEEEVANDDTIVMHDLRETTVDANLPEVLVEEPNDDDEVDADSDVDMDDDESELDDNDDHEGTENEDEDDDEDDDASHAGPFFFQRAFSRPTTRSALHTNLPCVPHTRSYSGHCNVKTVKDVNFYGLNDEYIVSGSDSGHWFAWDRLTGRVAGIWEGDGEVVNVVQGHPYEPIVAVSGIDHTIKIFGADNLERDRARRGIGITKHDTERFSSLSYGARRPARLRRVAQMATTTAPSASDATSTADPQPTTSTQSDDEQDPSTLPTLTQGLSSRRRHHEEYAITSQNDVDRRGGNQEAFITRSMLAQIARRIRAQQSGNGDGEGDGEGEEDGEGLEGPIVLGEDCTVM